MNPVQYFLMSGIGLLLFWLYYFIFLRGKTFFAMNRWYLLSALVISLAVPFASLFLTSEQLPAAISQVTSLSETSNLDISEVTRQWSTMSSSTSIWPIVIPAAYGVIALLLLVRLIWGIRSALFMVKQSERLIIHGQEVYANDKVKEPISLFNKIYIPTHWKNHVPYEIIIHEREHINKKHFIDLVFIELSIIVFWFNPVIYQLKKAIRINLEYLADREVILQGGNLLAYQSLLVSQSLESSNKYPITTNFAAPLKNRISMMNKTKTRNWGRLFIIGALPMTAGLLAMNTRPEVKAPILEFAEPLTSLVEEVQPKGWPIRLDGAIKITAPFGERMHPILKEKKHHDGVDIKAKEGTPIYATADGVVELAKFDDARGYYVQIKHGDKYATQYAHMKNFVVMQNQKVFKDQLIGYVGNTGASTAPHLHYEIHEDGKPVDPKLSTEGC
ncbi:M23/M56 family metallopeptidase [Fulvivirga lutimaris]|uniref:M23/M56 family metallopeptidase n=1 Tax=Fulvivirga lutimaris TaxID=1819566 RepID=UPI0012BCA25A|nr:M23/M56 family metallopeptidase [Fulvivirga lutimaris]MTI41820.1 hypothetical protein [Fulvivirga lutimaris]